MALTRVSRHIIDEPFNPTTVSATDVTATNINASGIGTVGTLRVTGDLTVEGTTTTLDSILTEVDRLEVSANSTVAAGIITQTGSGDILNLFDGSTEVFTVTDGGKVGIEAPNPSGNLNISYLQVGKGQVSSDHSLYNYNTSFTNNAYQNGNGTFAHITSRAVGVINIQDNVFKFLNGPGGTAGQSATLTERFTISSGGNIGLAGQTNPADSLHIGDFATVGYELKLSRNALQFKRAGNSFIDQKDDAGHILFRTTSNNLTRLRINNDGTIKLPNDNQKLTIGSSEDLQLYHNGTHSYIDNVTNGALIIRNTSNDVDVVIESDDGSGGLAGYFRADGSTGDAILYHYGNVKLATKSTGIQVTGQIDIGTTSIYGTGDISMGDNDNLRLGGGDDLRLYHDATDSFISNSGPGQLYIKTETDDRDVIIQSDNGSGGLANYVKCDGSTGAVELSHYGSLKLSTAAGGVNVAGNINLNGADGYEIRLGAANDLKLYHNATDSYIDNATGDFYIRANGDDMILRAADNISIMPQNGENGINVYGDGPVDLYYDNDHKFQTTATGAKVLGALEVTQEYPSTRPVLDLNFAATKSLDRRITFSRRGTATYTAENGLIKYAATNEPRFDHDPITGESLGLLIEEGRTNLINYSSEINRWTIADANVTANVVTAPDGTLTADKVALSGTSGYALRSLTIPANNIHTYSVYMKKADNNFGMLRYRWNGSNYDTVNFDLVNGTTSRVPSGVSSTSIINVGNGWYRCIVTFTPTSTTTSNFQIRSSSEAQTGSSSSYTGTIDGTRGVYAWGAQVEAGAFATSYIPTSGDSVTREDDNAFIKGTNFSDIYNETEGTIFAEFNTKVNSGNTSKWAVSLRDPANNNNYIAVKTYAANMSVLQVQSGGSTAANLSVNNSVVIDQFRRVAASFKLNDFDGADGGTLLTGDTSGAMPTGITQMDIGRGWSNSDQKLEGHIKSIKYYRTKLPDAQLQGLTQQ